MSTVNQGKQPASQDADSQKKEHFSKQFETRLVSVNGRLLLILKAGSRIRVITNKDDRNVATCVESLDKNAEFAQCD